MAEGAVTDLTGGEEQYNSKAKEKGKKEKKKDKAPKATAEREEAGDQEPEEKVKKKSGTLGVVLLMALVLILLIGGFGVALFFDALGSRQLVAGAINDPLIDLVIWLDPTFNSVDARLRAEAERQEARFLEREQELNEREADIEASEQIVSTLEEQVSRREADLERREAQLQAMADRTVPLHQREMTEQEKQDMLSLSNTYSQMAPDVAARIMVELYDARDVAGLLYFMPERNRSAIMAAMEPWFAAHITEILLY